MKRVYYGMLGLGAILVAVTLWWRLASRKRRLPCPTWLAWMISNPLLDVWAATEATLDHIGLQPGERGLDVGSGPGRLAIPAAQRVGPTGSIVALDVQTGMLDRLRERAARAGVTNISMRLGDITTDESLPADSVDRAWLVTVLGEIPDRAAALRNIRRILKPGGILSISEILADPHYQRRETVLQLAQEAGFEQAGYWRSGLAFTQNLVKPQ